MVIAEAQRTLVKSPPELWSELSDPAALARHLGELGEIRIVRTQPEQSVEWESDDKRGTVEIQPSGWGTKVRLSVTIDSGGDSDDNEPPASPDGSDPATAPSSDLQPVAAVEPPPPRPAPPPPPQSSPKLDAAPTEAAQAPQDGASAVRPDATAGKPDEAVAAAAAPQELGVARPEPARSVDEESQARSGDDRPSRGLLWRIRRLGRALRGETSAEKSDPAENRAAGRQHTLGTPQTAAAITEPRATGNAARESNAGAQLDTSASRATEPQPENGAAEPPSRTGEEDEKGAMKPSPTPPTGQDSGDAGGPWSRARDEHPTAERPTAPAGPPWSRAREDPHRPADEPRSRASDAGLNDDGDEEQATRTAELLSAMLDSLGEAHHRPFSRA
jgi:hypothetical protein